MREDDFDDDTQINETVTDQPAETATEQPPMPTIPPLRTFKVYRWEQQKSSYNYNTQKLTEYIIEAHSVQSNERANLLQFLVFAIDPVTGPGSFVRRAFNGWDNYEEVLAPTMVSRVTH